MISSGEMTDILEYKKVAKCVEGKLEGLHATKNEKGHVIIIEEDIAYDFWDSSFSKCKWEIESL